MIPAIQIPVLTLCNTQQPDSNVLSVESCFGIFIWEPSLSDSSATEESRKNAPIRIQSDFIEMNKRCGKEANHNSIVNWNQDHYISTR